MAYVTIQKVFATGEEAHDFAITYSRDMWGYDPLIRVSSVEGQWIVDITRCASCD